MKPSVSALADCCVHRTWSFWIVVCLAGVLFAMFFSVRPAQPLQASDAAADNSGELDFDPTQKPTVQWLPEPVEVPDAMASRPEAMRRYTERLQGGEVTFEMVPIPGGSFLMGSPETQEGRQSDEGPVHEVQVEPFWMGKCEVTWQEFELWASTSGLGAGTSRESADVHARLADAVTRPSKPFADISFGMGKDGCPAICMTQLAARCYCKWLSAKTGRYYRLPTEAEWEYACRAGTTTAYSFGDDVEQLDTHGWYFDNGEDRYHPVATRKPNPWGLYDMHGNVAEWVLDHHSAEAYRHHATRSSVRPYVSTEAATPHVVRGGSWDSDPEQLRSAARDHARPEWKADDPRDPQSIWYNTAMISPGFRVVRPWRVPTAEEAADYEPDWQAIVEYDRRQTSTSHE
jgi:formylglycine-generating enzyme required for sulfatase activity